VIFATATRDLNEADFISHSVEWSGESYNKSIGCCHHGMETPRLRDIAGQTSQLVCLATIHANVASGSAEEIANVLVWKSCSGPFIRGQKVVALHRWRSHQTAPLGQLAKAVSLYGRALVKRRKGDIAGSEADIATALAIRPAVADYMALYGIK
jgi:hypothetical protein